MLINLTKSHIFTVDPARRFAREYHVSVDVWNEVWKRHTLQNHDIDSLTGYVVLKTDIKKKRAKEIVRRWIIATEIYCAAQHVMRMGVRVVDSALFGVLEQDVFEIAVKSLKSGRGTNSRILL